MTTYQNNATNCTASKINTIRTFLVANARWYKIRESFRESLCYGKCSYESEHDGNKKDYSRDASLLVKHLLHLILESHHEESSKMIED